VTDGVMQLVPQAELLPVPGPVGAGRETGNRL
jgi:hypothetical protein